MPGTSAGATQIKDAGGTVSESITGKGEWALLWLSLFALRWRRLFEGGCEFEFIRFSQPYRPVRRSRSHCLAANNSSEGVIMQMGFRSQNRRRLSKFAGWHLIMKRKSCRLTWEFNLFTEFFFSFFAAERCGEETVRDGGTGGHGGSEGELNGRTKGGRTETIDCWMRFPGLIPALFVWRMRTPTGTLSWSCLG